MLVRVLGFLGGTFVFAGIGVFIALQWDAMNSAARVIVTLGLGPRRVRDGRGLGTGVRFDKATAPLLLVAAALEPTGMLVAFDEYGTGGDWHWAGLITCGVMALQFGAVFASIRRSTPLFVALVFLTLFWWTTLDLLDVDGKIDRAHRRRDDAAHGRGRGPHAGIATSRQPWYFFGAAAFLAGLFDLTKRTPLEIAFLAASAGFVYLSVVVHSRTLLVVATLAILAYTGWFTGEHFADSIGWPLALIAFGIFMIGLSALAFRIDRDYVRKSAG